VGILSATRIIPSPAISDFLFLGELSLDGRIKPVKGSLSMALAAKEAGIKGIVVPTENSAESAVVEGISVYPAETLHETVDFLRGLAVIKPAKNNVSDLFERESSEKADFSEVKGQEHIKRALEVAAAGGHNIIIS